MYWELLSLYLGIGDNQLLWCSDFYLCSKASVKKEFKKHTGIPNLHLSKATSKPET